MTDKPILSVDLDTSAYDAFRAKFQAYQDKLKDTPSAWGDVSRHISATSSTFGDMIERMARTHEGLGHIDEANASRAEAEIETASSWARISSGAKGFAGNVGGATLALGRWSGLTAAFSSLLAGGGLYGIARMAQGVSSRRTNAMGYGLSYGEAQAYGTNFARLGNAQGLLSGFNEAMTSADARAPLYSILGPNTDKRLAGKSAGAALADALPDIKRFVDGLDPRNMKDVLHGAGLDRVGLDASTAQTIRALPMEEIEQIAQGFQNDVAPMGLTPELAEKWTEFSAQINRAGAEIETHFAERLSVLTPSIGRMSEAAVSFVDRLLDDGGPAAKWMDKLGDAVGDLGDWLGSRGFQDSVDRFVRDSGQLVSIIGQITNRESGAALNGSVPTDPGQRAWNGIFNRMFGVGGGANQGTTPQGAGAASTKTPGYTKPENGWFARHNPAVLAREGNFGQEPGRSPSAGPGAATPSDRSGGTSPRSNEAPARGNAPSGSRAVPSARTEVPDQTPLAPNSAAPNSEGANTGIRPGRNPDLRHVDSRLVELFDAGASHLPPGYRALVSEGYNPYGHSGRSMHHRAGQGAIDFVIVDPQGHELRNNGGDDPTGLYTKMHRHMEGELQARYPDLAARHAMGHGPDFETSRGSGRADWMHVDLGGARGSGMGHQRIDEQGPVPGEQYGRRRIPPEQRGQVNSVEIEDHTGSVEIDHHVQPSGPMGSGR